MNGYVVNRPLTDSNVGSNLSSLAGAHWLAQRLGRTLVVDWRGMSQLKDPSLNYFTEFFEAPSELLGVPTLYAPTDLGYEATAQSEVRLLEPGDGRRLGVAGAADQPYLVLQSYHGLDRLHAGSEATQVGLLRSLYRRLRPSRRISTHVEEWAAAELDAAFVIGVNVRTGNGRHFQPGMRYASRVDVSLFDDERRFLRLLERACRSRLKLLPEPLRKDFQIFYATDSASMSELLAKLPQAVTRRRRFPPAGAGDQYASDEPGYDDHAAVEDTLTDMFLLERCDALVYNTSLFNQYARVVTGQFGGNLLHFESMRWSTRARRLSHSAKHRFAWPGRV